VVVEVRICRLFGVVNVNVILGLKLNFNSRFVFEWWCNRDRCEWDKAKQGKVVVGKAKANQDLEFSFPCRMRKR
jgi:hypothetical protein